MKSFTNNKSPENNDLIRVTLWEELKEPFMNLLNHAKVSKN